MPMTRDEKLAREADGLASRLFDIINGEVAEHYAVVLDNASTPEYRVFRTRVRHELIRLLSLERSVRGESAGAGAKG